MPGIFGLVDQSARSSELRQRELVSTVERMAAAMRYDSSYAADIVSCPELGACVGRVGFAYDGNSSETVVREAKLTILTAGEPDAESSGGTHNRLNGIRSIGTGAHDVLRVVQQYGDDGLGQVTGSFAGFLIDHQKAKGFLFNDRYGMERLFLHTDGPRTFFSSEAKAILAVAPRTRAFDISGLADFLACGCTLATRSLYRDIEVLEGGTVMTFGPGAATRRRYFTCATLEAVETMSADRFLEAFAESLRAAVNHSVNRAPGVGVSLTGGLDSRMIMASLDAPQGSVPCYTFGSMYRTTLDVSISRQVATRCGQPHEVLELGRGFLTGIRSHLEQSVYISDGYMGLSGAAELYLNRTARSIAPGRMTGNWGGELMRGVRAFKHVVPKGNFVRPAVKQMMSESANVFARTSTLNALSFALFHQMPVQGYGRYAIERSQVLMRTPFLANDVVLSLYKAPPFVRESSACAAAIIGRRPELLTIPTDAGRLGTGAAPIRFVRRAYRKAVVKAEYLTSHGAPDWLSALSASVPSGLIETRFLGRDKFQHFRLWIRKEFAEFVREVLDHDNTDMDSLFDMRRVAAMVDDHIRGRGNYTDEIDKLLTVAVASADLLKPSYRHAGSSTAQ